MWSVFFHWFIITHLQQGFNEMAWNLGTLEWLDPFSRPAGLADRGFEMPEGEEPLESRPKHLHLLRDLAMFLWPLLLLLLILAILDYL